MTKFGEVRAYDPQSGIATVVYARPDACEKCGACGTKTHQGSIRIKADCAAGNWVKVELPDGRFLQATAMAYLWPLAAFLAGLLAGYFLSGQNELWALAGSLIGLGAAFIALKGNERRIAGKPEWQPRITAVYETKPDMDAIGCNGQG